MQDGESKRTKGQTAVFLLRCGPRDGKASSLSHSTAQHSTAQHSTAQHSTAQHSTAQHSSAADLRAEPSVLLPVEL